jgi:hypothetical protein
VVDGARADALEAATLWATARATALASSVPEARLVFIFQLPPTMG